MNVTELWGEGRRADDDPDDDPLTKRPTRFSSYIHMHLYGERNVPLVEDYVKWRDKWIHEQQQQQQHASINQKEFNVDFFLPKSAKSSDMRQLRTDYSLFCGIVSQAMLDVSFEESNAARTMYNIMTRRPTKENSFADASSYFGKIANNKLEQLWDLATKMMKMKDLYEGSSSISGSKKEIVNDNERIKENDQRRLKYEREEKTDAGKLMITVGILEEVRELMKEFKPMSTTFMPPWANNPFKRRTGLGVVHLTKQEIDEVDAEEEAKTNKGHSEATSSSIGGWDGSNATRHKLSPKEAASELLVDICYRYVLLSGNVDDAINEHVNEDVSTLLSYEQLAKEISAIISEQTFDSLEARLFDLLGENGVEYIIEIIEAADQLKMTDFSSINQAIRVMMNDGSKSKKQLKKEGSRDKKKKDIAEEEMQAMMQSDVTDHLKMLNFGDEYIDQERSLGLQKMGYDNESWRENLAPAGVYLL